MNARERWDALHARKDSAADAFGSLERTLGSRYGWAPGWDSWISNTERKALDRKRSAIRRVDAQIFKMLDKISPRDWHSRVPAHWVCENLTWEDAVRPLTEPLSVVPPCSYGSTEPLR
jgi:hypothetical protein